ncbi:MAG TPA: IS21 family transposase [Herpetosiphonaceae bacterium]|nr:IS21 family transposase [Herpetosiphonaceae bacterium]
MDIRELLRHLQATSNVSAIQRATGLNRRTILRYQAWATTHGLLTRPLPALEELQQLVATTLTPPLPPQAVSSVEPYRTLVLQLRDAGVEGTAIWQRLQERGYQGSLSSIYRFLQQLAPPVPTAVVRVERAPGTEAQVDFGYAGRMIDPASGALRKAWAFVMLLAWSRHQFVEFVFDQSLPTWIQLHQHAFAFFGGVPQRIVLDNLKAGIVKACFDDPQVTTSYRECAEHYGFLIAPCRPRTPEHKGKVEQGGVHYVKRNFLGGRTPTTITQANADVLTWCRTTAGERVHGTTKAQPLARFQISEQAQLRPLPPTSYDLATWKQVTLYRDCYVVFEQAFYSAPFRLIGQRLWVRGGSGTVCIYTADYALVATHSRATQPGERFTHPDHLPPEKLPGLEWTRERCEAFAAEIGPATSELVQTLFADPVVDRHSRVVRVLKLRDQVGEQRLEAACARALRFGDLTYRTLKHILERGLEAEAPAVPAAAPARTFVRSAAELLGHVFGGLTWN